MKSFLKSTYKKSLVLIIATSTLFLILFSTLYFYTAKQEKAVYKSSVKQFSNEINSLVDLKAEPFNSAIIDYTYWDEFLDFIELPDDKRDYLWYDVNIGNMRASLHVDYLTTFSLDKKQFGERKSEKIKTDLIFSKEFTALVLDQLYTKKITSFYYEIPEGIMEIHAATVHPYSDPSKTKTKPRGYFLIGKLLDKDYFTNLQMISGASPSLLKPKEVQIESDTKNLYYTKTLLDFNNTPLKSIVFKRRFDISYRNTKNIIKIIVVFFLINLVFNASYLKKIIYKPLSLVKHILHNRNSKKNLQELQRYSGEFGEIGKLFQKSNDDKKALITAKNKAEESDLLKSAFLTNLSHEIRTPMNAIIGFTDILETEKLNDEERNQYFEIIKKSGKNLVSIIDDLIDMSKIDSSITKAKISPFNLDESLTEIYNNIKVTIPKEKDIQLVLKTPNRPITHLLISDDTKLKQTLVNLLNNAVKFSTKGEITFGYEIEKNDLLRFTVKDSGLGIPKKEQENIFNRFKRIQTDDTMDVTGLGLGLSICKAYITMLGGEISVSSEEHKGATFTFSIPLKLGDPIQKENQTTINTPVINNKNLTILIAEDDNINFLLAHRILSPYNHNIIRAKDGLEAVTICEENKTIDLIIMDLKMPKLTGFEALKQIRIKQPYLPIIAHTAYSSVDDKQQIFNAGFNNCVTKPLDKLKLLKAIDSLSIAKYQPTN